MGGTSVLGLERVEDAVAGVADLERIPGDGALLSGRDLAARLQEGRELVALPVPGFEQGENSELDGHRAWPFDVQAEAAACSRR
jgi:hypothetical protein